MPQATRAPCAPLDVPSRPAHSVAVTVPARLHFGLLDLGGSLGRRFGSFGLTLEGLSTRLHARRVEEQAASFAAEGPDAPRVERYARRMAQAIGFEERVAFRVERAIPAHSGLGSGTQLALATATALCRLAGHDLPAREMARLLGRGARSGVGLGAFEQGGVLLDGGRGPDDVPPPIVARHPLPDAWRLLLILDRDGGGLHGPDERAAFEALPPFPDERAGHLCRLVLLKALPALVEREVGRFGAAVTELQQVVGDHFAPAQGGRYASRRVAEVLNWLESEGVAGFGQSSWGPTGFAILGSAAEAERLAAAARERWDGASGLSFEICRGRNTGARVEAAEALTELPGRRTG